jgi:amino acid adenylation domain-containing protein
MGLEHGDKIAFLMDNGLFTAQLFLGTMYGGFVSVPLNVRAGVSQLSYMLDHCDAKVVFVGSQYASLIKEAMANVTRPIDVVDADIDSFSEENEPPYVIDELPPLGAEDAALLMYSSGTTGQPKGAVHTHRSVLAHGKNSILSHELTAEDRSLLVLPLYHINAECVTLMPTLMSGGSVIIPHGFVVSEFWNWLDDYRCTWSALVPTIISQLLDWKDPKAESRAAAFRRIRFLRTSSAPLSPALHREFLDKFKLPLIQAMGSSEAGNVFSNPVPPGANKIGSPGLPWGFETKIVGREGEELPAGEAGEVLIRGEAMMQGYYKDPAGTAAALDADKWLHTGDLAYRDEDGYFFVIGRSKELIIKGGMNIAPKQIDEILETHPAVLEAAAVGVPDRYVGEDLIAFVVTRKQKVVDEKELLAFCEHRLGHFKTPTRIYFVADLPKGPSGKVQRLKLQEKAAQLFVAQPVFSENQSIVLGDGQTSTVGSAPRSGDIEQIISETWAELLQQPQVDIHCNFFALGGHSLLAIRCLSGLREKLPVPLSLSDFFENPSVAQLAALVRRRLRRDAAADGQAQPDETSAAMQQDPLRERDPIAGPRMIPQRNRALPCPLSPAQERLWFVEQLNPGLPVYCESEAVRLCGEPNVDALEQALNAVIGRHEILRSTIQVIDGQPTAVVHEKWPLRFKKIDLSPLAPAQREAEVERLLIAEPRRLYHLEVEPGIRATLLRLGPQEHVFILLMHHIVCDWSSEGVLWRELSALYRAISRGQSPDLPALPIQHGDYAAWQQKQIANTNFAEDLAFWEDNLRGAPELLELPTDRPRPRAVSYRGRKQRFRIDRILANALRECSRREKTSLFTIFAAALNTLLYRYSGQEDILLGIPIADRDRPELQPLIGFLLQIGVLRTKFSGEMTFRELLAVVQKGVLGLYDHRVPFDQVVSRIAPQRDLSYAPLFQVMINWRDRDQLLSFIGIDGLVVESLLAESRTAKFDLALMLTIGGDTIDLEVEYSTDLFDEARIERMVGHFSTLLEAAAASPDRRLSDLPLLTQAERQRLLVEWNQTAVAYPKDQCVHQLFEEQVERTPDATAVAFKDKRMTYRQLNERANQLAHYLQKLDVGPDTLVGICVERSLEMVVGLLGILKAGGAYVPLDPAYPAERLAYMLEDSAPVAVLTDGRARTALQSALAGLAERPAVLDLERDAAAWADWPADNPDLAEVGLTSHNLAYVIYTSGSTGQPKGVLIEHSGLCNYLYCALDNYAPIKDAIVSSPLAFDATVTSLYTPLLSSGVVRILPEQGEIDSLNEQVGKGRACGLVKITPSHLEALGHWVLSRRSHTSVQIFVVGGEALPASTVELWRKIQASVRVINEYGPTETVVGCIVYDVPQQFEPSQTIKIGRPISNTRIYLLDAHREPVPIGVSGEIYIGGAGVARGYLNRPELTAERFISSPFVLGDRLYRTGDLARYLPDGTIEYLGRLDHQVKIRGFRIELGEIESVLAGLPGVREAVALAREDVPGDKRLAAYLTAKEGEPPTDSKLRGLVRAKLPDYMIPSAFVILDRFPLTPNGKVDRKALPRPDFRSSNPAEYAPPEMETEKAIAGIWRQALGLERVGLHDNFFELGGHSLLAVRVIAEINKTLNVYVTVPQFFQNPTIERLARSLESNRHVRPKPRVLRLQPGHAGPPLYFIGAGPVEIRIAKLMGEDRAIFGTDAPMPMAWRRAMANADRAAWPTMEQLGALHGGAVRAHAGTSPCVVAGYSFQGKVVIEAARALQRAGGNLLLVLLIDSTAWTGAADEIRQTVRRNLQRIRRDLTSWRADDAAHIESLSASLLDSLRLLRWLLARGSSGMKRRLARARSPNDDSEVENGWVDEEGTPVGLANMQLFFRILLMSFQPHPLDAAAVLFRTMHPGDEMLPKDALDNGWGDLFARGLEVVQARGDHWSLVRDERNTAVLARQINAVLDRHATIGNEGRTLDR